MPDALRIAVAQAIGGVESTADQIAANGVGVRALMREAAAAGARIVQFHEGAISSYPDKRWLSSEPGAVAAADWSRVPFEAVRRELDRTSALAAELEIWVVLGSVHPLTPPHRPLNSLYVIDDRGRLVTRYDKRLLSHSELSHLYTPGVEPVVFEVDGWRFGCLLCIEVNFADLFAEYERLDVDCVLVSSYSADPMFGLEVQGQAAANSFWVAFAPHAQGSTGVPAGVAAPNGQWLGQAPGDGTAALAVVDLEPDGSDAWEAVRHRRPWRRRVRAGVHEAHRVADPRLEDRRNL